MVAVGIGIGVDKRKCEGGTSPAPPTGSFLLLADGSSVLLLADGVSKLKLVS